MCLFNYLQTQTRWFAAKKETLIAFAKQDSQKKKKKLLEAIKSRKLNEKDFTNANEGKVFWAGQF